MVWSMTRQVAARPGRAHRLESDSSIDRSRSPKTLEQRLSIQKENTTKQAELIQKSFTNDENHQLDEECLQRFIKLNVRLMTDDHVGII